MDYKKQGKKNRAAGKRFELKVREDLEKQGWIVFRNNNDVEIHNPNNSTAVRGRMSVVDVKINQEGEEPDCRNAGNGSKPTFIFKQAKSKWNPFTKAPMTLQSGFPDFICVKTSKVIKPLIFKFPETYVSQEEVDKFIKKLEEIYKEQVVVYGGEVEHIEVPQIKFIECKVNGQLSKIEKEKVEWIEQNLHIPVFVATKGEKRGVIEYDKL